MRFKRIVCCLLAGGMLSSAVCHAGAENVYVATSHDTKPAPEQAVFAPQDFTDYTLLLETDAARYYWREDRDVLGIENRQNGFSVKRYHFTELFVGYHKKPYITVRRNGILNMAEINSVLSNFKSNVKLFWESLAFCLLLNKEGT